MSRSLLSGVNLYEHTLNAEQLANDTIEVLEEDCKLALTNWRATMLDPATMLDCAATNKAAMRKFGESANVHPLLVPCCPHGLANAGKKMKVEDGSKVLKRLTKMVKFGLCKARDVFKRVFKMNPKKGGSVRWYTDFEHGVQTNKIGLDRIQS